MPWIISEGVVVLSTSLRRPVTSLKSGAERGRAFCGKEWPVSDLGLRFMFQNLLFTGTLKKVAETASTRRGWEQTTNESDRTYSSSVAQAMNCIHTRYD